MIKEGAHWLWIQNCCLYAVFLYILFYTIRQLFFDEEAT